MVRLHEIINYYHLNLFNITYNIRHFQHAGNEWPYMKLFSYFVLDNDVLQLSDDGKLILLKEITSGKYDWLGKHWSF